MNTLHIIGTGPGDPELMTVKGMRVLEKSPVLIASKGKVDGVSTALDIVASLIDISDKKVLDVHFPMFKVKNGRARPEVHAAWQEAARLVLDHLENGDVAFPTLGDPAVYSTAFYVYATLREINPDMNISIIPGITTMSSCSAMGGAPLCLGNEILTVVPATFNDDRLKDILVHHDTIILMKVHQVMDRIVDLLSELDLLGRAVLYERCGMEDGRIFTDVRSAADRNLHYFSTIIVRKEA